jgi:type II secretory pathway pseudopilin PulG
MTKNQIKQAFRAAESRQAGMSIIELLAAVTIGIFVVMAAMEAYLALQSSVLKQDQITEMQQSGRAAMRVLSERLRMAGFSLPATLDALAGADSNPDTITVWHMDPVGCEVSTTANMGGPGDPLVCAGEVVDCFQLNRPAYIFDATAGTGEFFTVTGIQSSPEGLTHGGLSDTYPIGSRVSFIREVHFYLDRSDTLHPALMMQEFAEAPQVYAENIEDFQVRYIMSDGDTLDTPTVPSLVRRVMIDLVSRTGRQDKQSEQDYLRRNYAFQVSVRNNE